MLSTIIRLEHRVLLFPQFTASIPIININFKLSSMQILIYELQYWGQCVGLSKIFILGKDVLTVNHRITNQVKQSTRICWLYSTKSQFKSISLRKYVDYILWNHNSLCFIPVQKTYPDVPDQRSHCRSWQLPDHLSLTD